MTEDLTNRLHAVDDKLGLILTIAQSLTVRVDSVDSRLGRVEGTFDEHRHVLKRVVADIAQLQQGQRRLDERLEGLEGRLQGLEEGQKRLRSDFTALRRHVDHQFMKLSGAVEKRYREHDQRSARLETNTNQANSQT